MSDYIKITTVNFRNQLVKVHYRNYGNDDNGPVVDWYFDDEYESLTDLSDEEYDNITEQLMGKG